MTFSRFIAKLGRSGSHIFATLAVILAAGAQGWAQDAPNPAETATDKPVEQTIAPATILGDFRAWSAYSARDGSLICFARSAPTKRSSAAKDFPPAYVYITHRPSLGRRNVVSIVPGYDFATEATATVTIGGQSFVFLTRQNAAWLENLDQTGALVAAMRRGVTMTMMATTASGDKITDTYSLSGVTRATNAISTGCNIS